MHVAAFLTVLRVRWVLRVLWVPWVVWVLWVPWVVWVVDVTQQNEALRPCRERWLRQNTYTPSCVRLFKATYFCALQTLYTHYSYVYSPISFYRLTREIRNDPRGASTHLPANCAINWLPNCTCSFECKFTSPFAVVSWPGSPPETAAPT